MAIINESYIKQEKMDGIVYDMSPGPHYRHSIINGNIYSILKNGLKNHICLVFMENLDFKYHPEESDDYVVPDIMIICDKKYLNGGSYSGIPKFIVETLSPSTALRDKTTKKDAYEKAGVGEYWIVSPYGKTVEIYYLENGKYMLKHHFILQDDREDDHYNADTVISLTAFPDIRMKLADIFESMD